MVAQKVSTKFNEEFGLGVVGTVFTDQRGYHLKAMVASALDPRTKSLVGNHH